MDTERLKIFRPIQVSGLHRMGNTFDGGYVVHFRSLSDADCLVNYGVGYNIEFEKDFYRTTGKRILAFDPTLSELTPIFKKIKTGQVIPFLRHIKNRVAWIFEQAKLKRYRIRFYEEGIALSDSGKYKSLSYHYDKFDLYNKKIILKMDVEGAEYEVFDDTSVFKLLGNCLQVIIEFHDVSKNLERLISFMERISKTHSLIHIHSNNHTGTFTIGGKNIPDTIEMTLLLNEYVPERNYSKASYPIPGLDHPCHKLKPDIALDFFY
ncbi:MAG TPA: hypothetical protein VG367_10735 [Mucilaginibacter sp.]|jgi:hypothetical protein|nr:hypothetical protein [Mucilaginibacter sp.]